MNLLDSIIFHAVLPMVLGLMLGKIVNLGYRVKDLEQADQLLHDIASQDGWLRTDSTRELWERLQTWKRDHPTK